jgi:hypothetical protein
VREAGDDAGGVLTLLNGAYTRPDEELDRVYDHPGTRSGSRHCPERVIGVGAGNMATLAAV